MPSHPATAHAVQTLHALWVRRVEDWQRQIRVLPELNPHQRGDLLDAILGDLNDQLRSYMRLEEGMLLMDGASDGELIRLEHSSIGRAIENLEDVATAQGAPPHQAQAALARLCVTLKDHLTHEATAYLPRLTSSS